MQERGRRTGGLQVHARRQLPAVRRQQCLVAQAGRLRRPSRLGHAVPTKTENHAAGDYPNQSHGGDGLVQWTEADRPIDNTDLVLWYTFGHTHIPRPEDYPVMPTAYIGFMLKPNGFFTMNPANDLPRFERKRRKSLPMAGGGCCQHH